MDRFKCLDVTIACLFNIVLSIAIVVSIKLSFFKIKINYIMNYLITIINYLGYYQVTVDSPPVVIYAASIYILSIIALVGVIYMLIYILFIILGYNKAFLSMLGKYISTKWLDRLVSWHRTYSIYIIILESLCVIYILFTIITTSSNILNNIV